MLLPSGHGINNESQKTQSPQLLCSSTVSQTIGNGIPRQKLSSPTVEGNEGNRLPSSCSNPAAANTAAATGNAQQTALSSSGTWNNIRRYLDEIQDKLKESWTVHAGKEGRLYYCNHLTKTAGWLPPCENWNQCEKLPYGWERAIDSKGRQYFINHLNKTSTYAAPDYVQYDENPPEPRTVILERNSNLGFGFVAGSEKPVIVRFVTEGGPSMNKLQPGDQILAVNGENVKEAPRDHVIQLVRACESKVTLLVCQPNNHHYGMGGKKSTLLSAGKRAKLRSRPCRVRFAESVCVNGSPLFPPSAFSLGDICVPPMANVLKVFLENGQTKSFKYDATTTVQDVVTSLYDKLCIKAVDHFSLVLEHVKSLKQNKLTLLDQIESLAKIAARPGAHKLRCLFRVTFVPISAAELAQTDLNALDYLYMQCCNDVTQERFAPELQPEVALRLAALQIHQHALVNNVSPAKLTVKIIEREFGLERFVPLSLIEGMKRKELRRLIAHFLRLNSQMTGSSTKVLTQLQTKIHYIDIISNLPSYGAKCFSTSQRDGVERVLLVSPHFGLSQIAGIRNSVPQLISKIADLTRVIVQHDDDVSCNVGVFLHGERVIKFSMEDRDACEFALVLAGYYRLLTGKELTVDREREKYDEDNAPSYLAQHTVLPAEWSYLLPFHNRAHSVNFLTPPMYPADSHHHQSQQTLPLSAASVAGASLQPTPTEVSSSVISATSLRFNGKGVAITEGSNIIVDSFSPANNYCDRNMNSTNVANNNHHKSMSLMADTMCSTSLDLDIHSVMAMELLEDAKDSGLSDSSGGGSSKAAYFTIADRPVNRREKTGNRGGEREVKRRVTNDDLALNEAKNEEVLRRVAEMQRMVENSEQYLNEHGELIRKNSIIIGGIDDSSSNNSGKIPLASSSGNAGGGGGIVPDFDSDCESLNSSKVSSNEDVPPPGELKHSDSLILLAEAINHDLSGITKGLNSISGGNNQQQQQQQKDAMKIATMAGNSEMIMLDNNKFNAEMLIGNRGCHHQQQLIHSMAATTSSVQRNRINGLSQLLSDLQTLGNDCSQSESDSESIQSPSTSPIQKRPGLAATAADYGSRKQKNNNFRTSFGLHSPDSSTICGTIVDDAKNYNLKEYLMQLKEISKVDTINQDTDLAAKKLSEIYGFVIGEDTFIETDSDLIDLRALPPPQTPDELDALSILNAVPKEFRDVVSSTTTTTDSGDLDSFLSNVIVCPPTQKATPAKELTPEEIMSYIIPPPPIKNVENGNERNNKNVESIKKDSNSSCSPPLPSHFLFSVRDKNNESGEENLYSNSKNIQNNGNCNGRPNGILKRQPPVIEYATIERKGAFSCCSKSKQEETFTVSAPIPITTTLDGLITKKLELQLPPRQLEKFTPHPPARPPKSYELQTRYLPKKQISFATTTTTTTPTPSSPSTPNSRGENWVAPPLLPPRISTSIDAHMEANNLSPPKKPPLPPMTTRSILRNGGVGAGGGQHFSKQTQISINSGIGGLSTSSSPLFSPGGKASTAAASEVVGNSFSHLKRNNSGYRDIETMSSNSPTSNITRKMLTSNAGTAARSNGVGHYRSNSDCPPVCLKTATCENRPQLSLLCSPQMSRKLKSSPTRIIRNDNKAASVAMTTTTIAKNNNNGYAINGEALLAKTDIAMAGLLVKLDHVAAQCTAAQAAGGGSQIDEGKFQKARNELTEQTLALVTASKLLVVAMSDMTFSTLPEHLTSCLTAIRRITELTQDITRHTSAPLQTRNIVLKVHDVASSFRELAGVQIGPLGAGQLALQAECLANVLATLLRSLRVFSP